MKNQVVLVTGCSSGVGRELCMELKARGYQVIASARDLNKIEDLDADMNLKLDVTDPGMAKTAIESVIKKFGRIINVGSVSGKLTGRVNGGYCATKHALEAISDAARYELIGFGIQVTVLEPGAMNTGFFTTLSNYSDSRMRNETSPYHAFYQRDIEYRKRQKRADVHRSVEQICRIIEKRKLKARYKIS